MGANKVLNSPIIQSEWPSMKILRYMGTEKEEVKNISIYYQFIDPQ